MIRKIQTKQEDIREKVTEEVMAEEEELATNIQEEVEVYLLQEEEQEAWVDQ